MRTLTTGQVYFVSNGATPVGTVALTDYATPDAKEHHTHIHGIGNSEQHHGHITTE